MPEVLDPNVCHGLAVQLAALLLAAVGSGAWSISGQLSSALAALVVRATGWDEGSLVPQLLSLLTPQVAAAIVADLALGGAGVSVGVRSGAGGGAAVTAAVRSEASAVFALLQVLAGLPEACTSRSVSCHPHRKMRVAAALASDATIAPLLRACVAAGSGALAAAAGAAAASAAGGGLVHPLLVGPGMGDSAAQQGSALRRAALKLLQAWVEQLGTLPRGLEHEAQLINSLYEALVSPDTATVAAECLVGLVGVAAGTSSSQPGTAAEEAGYASDSSSSGSFMDSSGPLPSWPPAGEPGRGDAFAVRTSPQWLLGGAGGGGGGGSSTGAKGGARGGAAQPAVRAPGVAVSPERQLAAALLLQRLLDGVQALLQGAISVFQQQQQQGAVHAAEAAGRASPPPDIAFWSLWSGGPVLQAVCSVLCAAAAAVLPPALRGDSSSQARFNALSPHLMLLLRHDNPEVALSSVSFWQDTYLAQLMPQGSPSAQQQQPQQQVQQQQQQSRAAMLQNHLPLLGQLLAGLVARAALSPSAAAVATADARDLPEEVRMVRRELGATLRDLVDLVGLGHVAAFLERAVSEHAAVLGFTANAGGGNGSSAAPGGGGAAAAAEACSAAQQLAWTRLESALYAANVSLCSGGAAGAAQAAVAAGGAAAQGQPPVLPAVDNRDVASIVLSAATAVMHRASSLKLAGTALTLLGGMAPWFASNVSELARPLDSIRSALCATDEKLARNAATALNRLCMQSGCARILIERYGSWVVGLCGLLPGPETQLRNKPAPGVDLSSRELLVASLMRLACSNVLSSPQEQRQSGAGPGGEGQAASPEGPLLPSTLLQQLVLPRVMAAGSELERLAAALAANAASGTLLAHLQLWRLVAQQQQQQQQQQQGQRVAADGVARVGLCRPDAPPEVQQLGALAASAATRVGGLASLLVFIPAAQDGGSSFGGRTPVATPSGAEAFAGLGAVVPVVLQALRSVWPQLLACLCAQQAGGGAPQLTQPGTGSQDPAVLLLSTQEGAQLLPAACALVQGALLVAAAAPMGAREPPLQQQQLQQHAVNIAELLSVAVCVQAASRDAAAHLHGEAALQQQQQLQYVLARAQPQARGAVLEQALLQPTVLSPPHCVLQLTASCLPACGEVLARSAQHKEFRGHAVAVAAQAIQAACAVVQQACAALRPQSMQPERILQVLPAFHALLLHAPHALATSRELVEAVSAATISCMHCHDPEACRALLEWAHLLLACTAFGPQGFVSRTGSPATAAAALAARQAGQGRAGGGAAPGGRGGGGGGGGAAAAGLPLLLARCAAVPGLEVAFGGVAAQLDAVCTCSAPSSMGFVYTTTAVDAGLAPPLLPRGGSGLRLGQPVVLASLGTLLVLSLMVAASGGMPPDLMLPISSAMHGSWQAMGGARFRAWVRAAVELTLAPAVGSGALLPWSRLRLGQGAPVAALEELWGAECEGDLMKFKRSLKSLCGGKRKGAGGG